MLETNYETAFLATKADDCDQQPLRSRATALHKPLTMSRNKRQFRGNGAPIPDSLALVRSFAADMNPARPVRPSPLGSSAIMDMPLDLVDRIRSFPLFVSAPDTFLAAIGKHLKPQIHAPHDHILTEGDDAKAMYWIVRGVVAVTSRDGEAILAELKPGAFFGEIGILMDVPRTATIIARTKCLLVVLKKEDLQAELPNFPEVQKAIQEEAQERLTILNKKRAEGGYGPSILPIRNKDQLARTPEPGKMTTGEKGVIEQGSVINLKKRKSPSPSPTYIEDPNQGSALGSGLVNVRKTIKELPLFSSLPPDILHFLGLSAQPKTYAPFTDIIQQGSTGNEIYFIVRGEAEVIHKTKDEEGSPERQKKIAARPRLRQGQYFGEVASLALAPRRTATVRAISTVECLMISGDTLEELWLRCSPDLRKQVETTAKERYGKPVDTDVIMKGTHEDNHVDGSTIEGLKLSDKSPKVRNQDLPQVTFTPSAPNSTTSEMQANAYPEEPEDAVAPSDPDPYLSVDMDNMKSRSLARRGSWAPPTPPGPATTNIAPEDDDIAEDDEEDASPLTLVSSHSADESLSPMSRTVSHSASSYSSRPITPPKEEQLRAKRPRTYNRRPSEYSQGRLNDQLLLRIFSLLDIYQLMRLRQVSLHWQRLLTFHRDVARHLDLSLYNRKITNQALIDFICPFVGSRPQFVDLSNCYHVTDAGFNALVQCCGASVKKWMMKSVWDITAGAVLEMANTAKDLEEIDLSNCRKVSDNLLARIVGWVVTDPPAGQKRPNVNGQVAQGPPVGTVVGCPKLARLTLSYCKHVTDRSMAHLAVHAHDRLQSIDLTRCTTITDNGFSHWGVYRFEKLERLVLADCTYLTDNAIVSLTHAAKGLKELDLVS